MNFLVVSPVSNGQLCKLTVCAADAIMAQPYKVWAVDTGAKILTVNTELHKRLRTHYMNGRYESGALYGYSYGEMCLIITQLLGCEDDESVLENLRAESTVSFHNRSKARRIFWQAFLINVVSLLIKAFMLSIKTIGILMLVPFLIKWLSKPK